MFPPVEAPSSADLAAKIERRGGPHRRGGGLGAERRRHRPERRDRGGDRRHRRHRPRDREPQGSEGSGRGVTPLLAHAAGTDETLSLILLFGAIWVAWIGWSRLRGTGFDRMPRWGGWALIGVAVALAVAATTVPRALIGPDPDLGDRGAAPGIDRHASLPRAPGRFGRIRRRAHRATGPHRCHHHLGDLDDRHAGHRPRAPEPGRHAGLDGGGRPAGREPPRRPTRERTR